MALQAYRMATPLSGFAAFGAHLGNCLHGQRDQWREVNGHA